MTTTLKWPTTQQQLAEVVDADGQYRFVATLEEYWQLLGEVQYRADFYDHQIIASMSYESDLHSYLATELSYYLRTIFADKSLFRVYNSNRPVYVENCRGLGTGVFNADGMVTTLPPVRHEYQKGMSAEMNPTLLIEILSPSTRAYDFGTKLPCYKTIPTLQTILFVEQDEPKVFVYQRLAPNRWQDTEYRAAEDSFEIEGQTITLGQIYRGVYF
ncbi:MAG: Uma2 family endonuclease [Spirosomaceae bacterium]|nr:Uma2 family endonuclease [Spirosomataceae bacterium]